MSRSVISKDGTSIAYERAGSGPAVVLVTGGLDDGSENAPLARALSTSFTVYNYARRGRGNSGDTLPYAVEREIEDVEALIAVAGRAHLYGVSSGGALVLEAALAGVAAERLAVYEVPFDTVEGTREQQREYIGKLRELLAAGDRDAALELFMQLAGSSLAMIEGAKASPVWPGLRALAHTLVYDAACLGDRVPDPGRLARIEQPTLVMTGGDAGPFERAADVLARSIPRAERRVLAGQSHIVAPEALAPVLEGFFKG